MFVLQTKISGHADSELFLYVRSYSTIFFVSFIISGRWMSCKLPSACLADVLLFSRQCVLWIPQHIMFYECLKWNFGLAMAQKCLIFWIPPVLTDILKFPKHIDHEIATSASSFWFAWKKYLKLPKLGHSWCFRFSECLLIFFMFILQIVLFIKSFWLLSKCFETCVVV